MPKMLFCTCKEYFWVETRVCKMYNRYVRRGSFLCENFGKVLLSKIIKREYAIINKKVEDI